MKRSAPVLVKFTKAEREQLAAEVERLGLPSITGLVRDRALTGRVVIRRTTNLAAPDRAALNRVGANLHQLVKHLNYAGAQTLPVLADLYNDARATLDGLNAVLAQGAGGDDT